MVEPQDVGDLELRPEAGDPPAEALRLQHVPAIERIPPALTIGAEIVGWNAGDGAQAAVGGEIEERAVRPRVRAVGGDVDRDIAEDPDTAALGGAAHGRPLAEEQELAELREADLVGESRRLPA